MGVRKVRVRGVALTENPGNVELEEFEQIISAYPKYNAVNEIDTIDVIIVEDVSFTPKEE